ncbi:MAG: ankyrin repeat domain-containing protein [Aquimonas sp.]|nr:ankyrin repeat domain-containing protein [Aquimonas sp.]
MASDLHALARQGRAGPLREFMAGVGSAAGRAVNAADADGLVPLAHALQARADVEIVGLLLAAGADPCAIVPDPWEGSRTLLSLAISQGQVACVKALLDAGASVHYQRNSYDAVLDAAHAGPISPSQRVELLDLLIERGASVDGCSDYGERALLVLSSRGEFAGVARLLEAGADEGRLKWSPAMRDIALATEREAHALAESAAAALDQRDHGGRDALLLACAAGRVDVAGQLLALGADPASRDRNGAPALHVAIRCGQGAHIANLPELGLGDGLLGGAEQPALALAAEQDDAVAVRALLAAGAPADQTYTLELSADAQAFSHALLGGPESDSSGMQQFLQHLPEELRASMAELDALCREENSEGSLEATVAEALTGPAEPQSALHSARSAEVARLLLAAGADPGHLQPEARRNLLGLPPEPQAAALEGIQAEVFEQQRQRSFGATNPERMCRDFWLAMIRAGVSAHAANSHFGRSSFGSPPTWCAERFGQSITFLPDGRIVQVGGEHEDGYDPDFCIYNDVFVHHPDGRIEVFGYPEAVFPPTDFHSVTLCGDEILIVGGLGYFGQRSHGSTPVYRLCTRSWRISAVTTRGEPPGWIHRHRALIAGRTLRVWKGQRLLLDAQGEEEQQPLEGTWLLDLDMAIWRRE